MTRLVVALLLLAAVSLAGCTEPLVAPADAAQATNPELPGVTLYAWLEPNPDDGILALRGYVANGGDKPLPIRAACGQPWNSTITADDEGGRDFAYHQPGHCFESWWDSIDAGDQLAYLHSWDLHERGDLDVAHGRAPTWEASPGNYTWTLDFETRDGRNLSTTIAFVLPL